MIEACHFNFATIGMDVKEKNDLWDYCQKYKITLKQFDELVVSQNNQYETIYCLERELDELQFDHRKLERKNEDLKREVCVVVNSLEEINKQIDDKLKEIIKDVETLDFNNKEAFVLKLKDWQKTTKYLERLISDIDTDF